MIIYPHINKLMDADVFGWHPDILPRYWVRLNRGRHPWVHKLSNITGLHVRLRWFGVCFHFGSGTYSGGIAWGPFKCVIYKMDIYQEWLESWMGY